MNKRNIFNLVFKDFEDWYITLYTTESKTEEEIISLIKYWGEANNRNNVNYSPVDIMEELCLNNEGWYWYWTDMEHVEIDNW